MEDSQSVPVGSPAGQTEPPVPTGSLTQPRQEWDNHYGPETGRLC
jgi:hypothetical protein